MTVRVCELCGGSRFIRPRDESGPYEELPCPKCCILTDPPDLTADAIPEPEPLELELDDIHDAPTIPAPPPVPDDRPTPVAPVLVTPEARPTPYRTALERLPPLPIPEELMRPKTKT